MLILKNYIAFITTKKSELKIKRALADVGHDTKEIKATDQVYEKLDACCKYRNKKMKNINLKF